MVKAQVMGSDRKGFGFLILYISSRDQSWPSRPRVINVSVSQTLQHLMKPMDPFPNNDSN